MQSSACDINTSHPTARPQAQTTHGYARLHVNATTFHIQAIDSSTGKVFDEAVLAPRQAPAAPSSTRQQASLFAQRAEALLAAA